MKKTYIMTAAVIIAATFVGVAAASVGHLGFFGRDFVDKPVGGHQVMLEKKAEILGLDVEALQAKLNEGQTMQEIFESQGITKEDFMLKNQEQMHERMEERLNLLVEEGRITQEQANEKLKKMMEMQEKMTERMENCPEECQGCMMMGWPKMGRGIMSPGRRPFIEQGFSQEE